MGKLQLNKYQELALGQQLSVGGAKHLGTLINAGLMSGLNTHFQGCWMENLDTEITYTRLSVDGDKDPYYLKGVSQLMTLRSSDSTAVNAGFPDAAAAGDTGVLRLLCRDTNGANALAFHQENALWVAPATNYTAIFDIKQWTERGDAVGVQFSEFGLASTCSTTHIVDSSKVPAYVDGSNDLPYASVKLYGNQGRLVVRSATSAALQTSAAFDLPTGNFAARFEYHHGASGGSPAVSLFIDDRFVASINTSVTGPLQVFARNCHGANYVAATHAPSVLDIDQIVVALPA